MADTANAVVANVTDTLQSGLAAAQAGASDAVSNINTTLAKMLRQYMGTFQVGMGWLLGLWNPLKVRVCVEAGGEGAAVFADAWEGPCRLLCVQLPRQHAIPSTGPMPPPQTQCRACVPV
jgi:hypothetical protein